MINLQPKGTAAAMKGDCHAAQPQQREAEPHAAPQEDSIPQQREFSSVSHSVSVAQQSTGTQEKMSQPLSGRFREDSHSATVPTKAQEQRNVEVTTQPAQPLSNSSKWSDLPGSPANISGVGGFSPFAFFMVPMMACPSASGSMLPVPMMMPFGNGEGGGMPFGFPGMKTEKVTGDTVSSSNEDEDEMQVVTIPEMKFLTRVPKKKQLRKATSLDEPQTPTPAHTQQQQAQAQSQLQLQQQLQQGQRQAHVSHVEKHQGRLAHPGAQQPTAEVEDVHNRNHHQQQQQKQQQQPAMARSSQPGMVPAACGMPGGGSSNMLQHYHMVQEQQLLEDGSSSEEEEEPPTDDDAPIILDGDDVNESTSEYHKFTQFQRHHASLGENDASPAPGIPPPQPHPRHLQKQQVDSRPDLTSSHVPSRVTSGYTITSLPQYTASEPTSAISHSKLPIMMPPALMPQQGMSPGITSQLLQQAPSAAQPSLLTLASAASSIAVEASLQGSPQGPGSAQHQLLDAQR